MYRPGDIVMVRPKGILFHLVRWWTKGSWGHVGIVVGSVQDHILIAEAGINGVDINDLKWRDVQKEPYSVYRINDIDDEKRKALVEECLKFVGMPYDVKAWINFIIGKTWFGTDKEIYCSEMIYRAVVELRIVFDFYHPEKITPHEFFKLIEDKLTLVEEVTF